MFSKRENAMTTDYSVQVDTILVKNFAQKELDILKVYPGKPLLIIIYNNQCIGCVGRAIPLANDFQKEFNNIQVVGLHTSFKEEVIREEDIRSIFTIENLPFPIYIDSNRSVYDQFKSQGTPQWVLIQSDGHLYRSIFGSMADSKNRLMYALESLS